MIPPQMPAPAPRPSLIDAELANMALQVREIGEQFKLFGGVSAEQWLEARGL